MSITKKDKSVSVANEVITIMEQFAGLRHDINELVNKYNSEQYSSVWANFPTCTENPDGSLGAPDEKPNTDHPMDIRIIPSMFRSCKQPQLVSAITFLMDFQKFLSNQSVLTAQRSQTIDDLAS